MGQNSFVKIKKLFKNKKVIGVLTVLLFLFLFLGRKRTSKTFATQKAEKGKIEVTVSASGTVRSKSEVKVQFQTSGKLAWLGVKEGDLVKKGQALASLDKNDLEKRFKKEMNDYLNERWDFEQTQDDYHQTKENRLVTDSIKRILEKAQFDLENAVLDAEIADLAIKLATVYSPINGIITELSPPVAGLNVIYSTSFIEIMDPEKMEFEAIVDETDIAGLKEGQKTVVTLDAFPGEEFEGETKRISFKASQTSSGSTGFSVFVSLPNELLYKLKSGFNGDIKVAVQKKEGVLIIPPEAILEEEENWFVFKVDKNRVKKTKVETGISSENSIEITSGLEEGQIIVINETASLKDNQKIE